MAHRADLDVLIIEKNLIPLPGIEPWFFSSPTCSLVTVATIPSLISYSGMSLKVSVALSCCLRKVVLQTHVSSSATDVFQRIAQHCVFVCCTMNLC